MMEERPMSFEGFPSRSKRYETRERCVHRAGHIAWCLKLGRFCNAPAEYDTCPDYTPRSKGRGSTRNKRSCDVHA
jgi:hypothetical protein